MKSENENKIIPAQEAGASVDTSETVQLKTTEEAIIHFKKVKQRLLNISGWHSLSGAASANFILTDQHGDQVNRLAEQGDHFMIKIPAPENETGDGYDWVQIQSIEESNASDDSEFIAITARPASSPQNADQSTAHFFKEDASSTFLVKREQLNVTAAVHGRNEIPNTDASISDSIRNVVVAVGAMLGFSKIQWKSLVKGLVKVDE